MPRVYTPKSSYLRVATASPIVSSANVAANVSQIRSLYLESCSQMVSLVVFPELSITGYSLGDVVRQHSLLRDALFGLNSLAILTKDQPTAMIVGLPYCAAFLADGQVKGIVTKSNLPNYNEFYEQRWYKSYEGTTITTVNSVDVLFGQKLLFDIDNVLIGIEICEDMWVPNQPSRTLSQAGALIIANPSASPELVGKAEYRTELVRMTSAIQRCAYVYSGADWTESTTDIVMSGNAIIAENGTVLSERPPFDANGRLRIADIDIDHLVHDRMQDTTPQQAQPGTTRIATNIARSQKDIVRTYPTSYFLPSFESKHQKAQRLSRILEIQAHGLARRVLASDVNHCVLGLSGGLDSTLALIVCIKTATILQRPAKSFIHALVMPGPASSSGTQSNALALADALGVTAKMYQIHDSVNSQLATLKHVNTADSTYENVQARSRTALLFNYANKVGGLVVGTGDLSELALGWCTFGGDQLSGYNVNASIPKTLVKNIIDYVADSPEYTSAQGVLRAILATPISPELTAINQGEISQSTEAIIGPYIVHDFFLYHVIRYGDAPEKIAYIATKTFADTYTKKQIHTWLQLFYERFASNQFKRSAMPDGPKVGSIALSPRGDWRMPSDMSSALWQ